MTYQETLDWLFGQLPMYQRIGGANYKIDLEKTHALMELLGHPEQKLKAIHVAGTNGKGSTSHMLASVLQESGYKTGLYTSPHLIDFRERVKINGVQISEDDVLHFVETFKDDFKRLELSFFEMTVGLAFYQFAQQEVDIAVIETGMGGRLDSTNVLNPLISIITNIGLDHQQFLGETLEHIAGEKAGIIKKNTPIIIGETQDETAAIFLSKAKELDAPIFFADQTDLKEIETDLKGWYQKKNMKTALLAIIQLEKHGLEIGEANIVKGFAQVVKNTDFLGRWQIINEKPLTICDTGHNVEGILEIVAQIKQTPHQKLHMVWGMISDKNPEKYLSLLPAHATYYFTEPSIPRKLKLSELLAAASKVNLKGQPFNTVKDAYRAAKQNAQLDDLIFIGGSTFIVADFLTP